MIIATGVSIQYILLDVCLASGAFVIGFVVAYLLLRTQEDQNEEGLDRGFRLDEPSILEAERADMAVQQLKDLASHVAGDVGAHNKLMTGISNRLGSLDSTLSDSPGKISDAVQEILVANKKLQERLADAEKKIQTQAEELRTQQSEARTDSLTQLANRRAFDDSLDKGIARFRKESRPVSLILFDVDHFKRFNDTYGHQAGDEVLRQVAITLMKTAKASDLAFRYGGEEFGLVMSNTTISQARVAAERIRLAIEATKVQFEGKTLSVTASMGVAEIAGKDDSARLVRRADEAIYSAKRAGRNCGFWHDGETCLSLDDAGANNIIEQVPSHRQLPDQAAFAHELQRRIAESHRHGHPLTVMYLKVVGFAALEREFGSALGDLLLDSVSQFVGGTLRDMDLLGRAEPGEFIVMLPGSTEREATVVGNRIQTALANCEIPLGTTRITLQVSLGISQVEPADDADSFIERSKDAIGGQQKVVAIG